MHSIQDGGSNVEGISVTRYALKTVKIKYDK